MPKKVSEEKPENDLEEDSDNEESELVEIIEESEESDKEEEDFESRKIIPFDENRFRELLDLSSVRSSAPVLEEVTAVQEGPRFIPIRRSAITDENEENNSVNYSTGRPTTDGSKYDEAPPDLEHEFSDRVINQIGFAGGETRNSSRNNIFVTPESRGMDSMQSSGEDSYIQPKRFEHDDRGTPIERDQRKYKEFKL